MMRRRKRQETLAKAEAYQQAALATMPKQAPEPPPLTLAWLAWHLRRKYELERAMLTKLQSRHKKTTDITDKLFTRQ